MFLVEPVEGEHGLPRSAVAALGNFDGLHLGQQAVLRHVVERAAELDKAAMLITFEPHPLSILRPGSAPPRILTPGQRERLLVEFGIEALAVVPFTEALGRSTPEEFAREVLGRSLGVSEVVVGSGFRFGRDRAGDLATLIAVGEQVGFRAEGIPERGIGGKPISASRVRSLLLAGSVEEAATLLGRPPALEGAIARGDRMGQRLGWPTINLIAENELVPLEGVYVSRVHFPSFPATFDCVTNIGTRPTLYENYGRVVESHILNFRSDVYGERAELSFLQRLRDERLFPSVMDLSAQIARDVEATREYFDRRRGLEESGPVGGSFSSS